MRELMIVLAFFGWLPGMQQPMEKQALAIVQRVPVSELDRGLPGSPFSSWFEQVVGRKSGVIWQLGECGQTIGDPTLASTQDSVHDTAQLEIGDIPACVEANAVLPDGRKVVVMIRVGSFRKGITENPGFNFAMIEQEGELYLIKRLSDLPARLRSLTTPGEKSRTFSLPEVESRPGLAALNNSVSVLPEEIKIDGIRVSSGESESPLPPPPPPRPSTSSAPLVKAQPSTGSTPANPASKENVQKDVVLQGQAVTRVQPIYPARARMYNASGEVRVQVDISEKGRVTNAKAISGHPLLRDSAVDAARKWVFKPTTVDGVPVTTRIVLNFDFTVPN
jgi:TonB family protein